MAENQRALDSLEWEGALRREEQQGYTRKVDDISRELARLARELEPKARELHELASWLKKARADLERLIRTAGGGTGGGEKRGHGGGGGTASPKRAKR